MKNDLLEWLIDHYGQEQFRPGLERIQQALKDLLPELKNKRIVTIAGTNGKGETALRLSKFLEKRSHCLWISPHVERITERFCSEEGEISIEELTSLVFECHQKVEVSAWRLSFYEFLFLVFCTWSVKKNPEILLLEVGLGGKFDAVNALDAECVLLSSISRDHQEFLGNRYDSILQEKLGVLRPGVTLISTLDLNYLRERVRMSCQHLRVTLIDLESLKKYSSWQFSQRNQLLAYAAYLFLERKPLSLENWQPEQAPLEHRGEVWKSFGEWTFFGSHNVDGIRKLIQFLQCENYTFNRPLFDVILTSFSKRSEKDLRVILRILARAKLGKVMVTTFPHPKAAEAKTLEDLSRQEGLEFVENIGPQVHGWNNQKVLVLGSYYFLGYIQSQLRR